VQLIVSIDNGGTFTDVCVTGDQGVVHAKTLTTPYDLSECFVDALRAAGQEIDADGGDGAELVRLLARTEYLRYSSTVGTNALIQKQGIRLGILVDLAADVKALTTTDAERDQWDFLIGDRVRVLKPLTDAEYEKQVVASVNEMLSDGANRLVVSLAGDDRVEAERRIKRIMLRKYPRHLLGAVPVLFSHELTSDADHVRRTWTALLNSFLHPHVERFFWNAESILRDARHNRPLRIFHNDGNSARVAKTVALKTYSSGPRGGMEGARALARHYGWPLAITMDVGGTTTDVGVVRGGEIDVRSHGDVAGIVTSFEMCEIGSTGAGGSSVFTVRDGEIAIGPDSVGALPGPACFARGGEQATVTDAYLVAGIFDPTTFLGGVVQLDEERACKAIETHVAGPLGVDVDAAALAMLDAFNAKLADALPSVESVGDAVLLAFGGAGPLGACAVARKAGIGTVVVPRLAAVFSAFGVGFSDIAHHYEAPVAGAAELERRIADLGEAARRDMYAEGFADGDYRTERALRVGTNGSTRTIALGDGPVDPNALAGGAIMQLSVVTPIPHPQLAPAHDMPTVASVPAATREVLGAGGRTSLPVFACADLEPGATGSGPALIEDAYFTCKVETGWAFDVDADSNIVLRDAGSN